MRKTIGALVLVLLMIAAGGRVARAQEDPMAYAMDMMQQSAAASQAAAQAAADEAQANMQASMNAMNAGQQEDDTPPVPRLPQTPKPTITPKGGTFTSSVKVTIADSDTQALVFYTTDGKKPTPNSQRYAGPIAVNAKEKIQALAFDLNELPSGVVSKKFKVKSS